MRLTRFERFQYSSILLWKQMGVEGEDTKNTALCYSADNSADARMEGIDGVSKQVPAKKGDPEGPPESRDEVQYNIKQISRLTIPR